jgi:glycosyltransferase involved in cell wall biosynthesis
MRTPLAPPPAGEVTRRTAAPTFSIVVAAYQAAATIGEALASAFAQTVPPHEVVVCDDGSTDDLAAALAPYAERIRLISKENGGEASAKNAAARAASGEYVAFLDADDVYEPGRLEALGELAAARPDLDILTTDAVIEVEGTPVKRVYHARFPFPVEAQRREILRRNFVFGHAAVRRELVISGGGFDETIRHTTDWERWIRLILDGSLVGCVPEPLARYRLYRGSLSSQRALMLEGRIATLERAAGHPRLTPDEGALVADTATRFRRELVAARAREAVREGAPDARRLAFAAARAPGIDPATRVKSALAGLAPGVAGRVLRRRPVETTADVMLPPEAPGPPA